MWGIIIGVVVFALAVLAVVGFLAQRKYIKTIQEIEATKKGLVALNVQQAVLDARKLALTGQSLQDYQDLETCFNEVKNQNFLAIDNLINEALSSVQRYRLVKVRHQIKVLQNLLAQTEETIQAVQSGLADLEQVNLSHQKMIEKLRGTYAVARQEIEDQRSTFGPAYFNLLAFIDQLAADYQEFRKLTKAGDQAKASDVYEQLAMESTQLERMQVQVPELMATVNGKFTDQLAELADGYQVLSDQGFVFVDTDIPAELDDLDQSRRDILGLIIDLKLKEAKDQVTVFENQVQGLYATMQREIDAKAAVKAGTSQLVEQIKRLREQNQLLFLELERLQQVFYIDEGEAPKRRDYQNQIEQVEVARKAGQEQLHQKQITYSELQAMQAEWRAALDQVEDGQIDMWQRIRAIKPAFDSASDLCQDYVVQVKGMQQRLNRMDLPGLPEAYLDYLYNVMAEIERLNDALTASRVNMDEVQRQLSIVSADMDTLKERTQALVDRAKVAEQLLQYANRYRLSHQEVAQAIAEASQYYSQDHNYGRVIDVLGPALDRVDVGIYERIVNSNKRHQSLP
ncbi:septation ring formation regulator EzrA [Lactobacillaceae bacterium L1_55_11]|nr:septation ring formation regulator EzrA [Lactobacillaceae bacterium L1_55_11]